MRMVSNTSPLLNLAIINALHLIESQFPSIIIPRAVKMELQLDSGRPGTVALKTALRSGWIEVASVANRPLVDVLRADLDVGEAEAIALAIEKGASTLLLDEYDGRTAAKLLNLKPIGILGVLLRAKRDGEISLIAPYLDKLKQDAGFFIAPPLLAQVLNAAGES